MTGVVKFFNDSKGYGFIKVDDSTEEVFVHFTGIAGEGHRTLTAGQKVTFEVETDAETGKTRARDVK